MPIPGSFTKAGYTKDTKFKVVKADGPLRVGDIVVLDEDNSEDWASDWAFFKNSAGYSGDMYFGGGRAEVEAIVEDKKEEQMMTFDMTKCKIGDKLRNREGAKVMLTEICYEGEYCFIINDDLTVTDEGLEYHGSSSKLDIVGFWEEELPSDNDYPSPTITITHNLTIKGYTHVLTTEEMLEVFAGFIDLIGITEEKNND